MILHLRYILLCFQLVPGLNINLKKSEMICVSDRRDEIKLAECVNLPIKYLGLCLGFKFMEGRVWDPMINMFEQRLAGRNSRFLSKGGRLTLIKSTTVDSCPRVED